MKKIDPTIKLNLNDFCELFEQLPLIDEERKYIKDIYWELYKLMINNPEIKAPDAWIAVKNTFIARETQIKDRIK